VIHRELRIDCFLRLVSTRDDDAFPGENLAETCSRTRDTHWNLVLDPPLFGDILLVCPEFLSLLIVLVVFFGAGSIRSSSSS
jgi:hypothetical protein